MKLKVKIKKKNRRLKPFAEKDEQDEARREERGISLTRTDYSTDLMANMGKAAPGVYGGPMTVEDILIQSWNDFFDNGGALNQPHWLENNRRNEIRRGYEKLALLHGAR